MTTDRSDNAHNFHALYTWLSMRPTNDLQPYLPVQMPYVPVPSLLYGALNPLWPFYDGWPRLGRPVDHQHIWHTAHAIASLFCGLCRCGFHGETKGLLYVI